MRAASRLLAAALAGWPFAEAALRQPRVDGLSTFGAPGELAVLWALAGAGFASAVLRARARLDVARVLTLALAVLLLFGPAAIPAGQGARLALLGAALVAAAPALHASRTLRLGALALLCALPALAASSTPHGAATWLVFFLPPLGLTALLPALYAGTRSRRVVRALLVGAALIAAFALVGYLSLARRLDLPLAALTGTRLRLLGLHPNLVVPQLATLVVLGAALHWSGRRRPSTLCALLVLLAALLAGGSRTGALVTVGGLIWLALERRTGWARRARVLGVAGVAGLLLLPLSGATDTTITERSSSMVSKAVTFRSAMWELGRDTLAAAPWTGYGPGTLYRQAAHARTGPLDGRPKDDHPHSVVLLVGQSLGWPGLAALALLVAASLRRPRGGGAVAAGASAALAVGWAGNAIDLGGAQDTLYPTLALLLLALREADERPEPAPSAERPGPARVPLALGLFVALLGGQHAVGEHLLERARRAAQAAARGDAGPPAADAALAAARRWRPFDTEPIALQAQLAERARDLPRAERHWAEVADLRVGDATILHRRALARAAFAPDDPAVDAWLDEAVRADPLGPEAWRRRLDRARRLAARGRHAECLRELAEALALDPSGIAGIERRQDADGIRLLPAGAQGAAIPLEELLAAVESLRVERGADDPASAMRLRLREIELLLALGDHERADARARTLLRDEPSYLDFRLVESARARGALGDVLAILRRQADLDLAWLVVHLLDALSRQPSLDEAEWAMRWDQLLRLMPQQMDVLFDRPALIELLEARLRRAERAADALAADRAAEALDWASR